MTLVIWEKTLLDIGLIAVINEAKAYQPLMLYL